MDDADEEEYEDPDAGGDGVGARPQEPAPSTPALADPAPSTVRCGRGWDPARCGFHLVWVCGAWLQSVWALLVSCVGVTSLLCGFPHLKCGQRGRVSMCRQRGTVA